jgi:hypothetical protein
MAINTAAYFQNPAANKLYGSAASRFAPKTAAGLTKTGWKGVSGIKGGALGIGGEVLGNYLKPKEDMPLMGGEHGSITDKYDRRLQTAGPGIWGGVVKGATTGAQYGGGYGAIGGALIGGAYGAAKKHATTAYSDFKPEQVPGLINDAYQQYLGRDVEPGFADAWMAGQGFKQNDKGVGQKQIFGLLDHIKNSPEAKARGMNPQPGINTGPSNFSPMPIPSSFLSPEKVAMLDESRRRQLGY